MLDSKVFLCDEPLSHLDAKLRMTMRAEISKLQKQLETTMIYVTHDQVEAMTMGDRIVIVKDGYIMQVGRRSRSTTTRRMPLNALFRNTIVCRIS